jgi:hypothetical protein
VELPGAAERPGVGGGAPGFEECLALHPSCRRPQCQLAPGNQHLANRVTRAFTYTLNGTQFNGLSHGAAYGDDAQANTNFPIVQIVNTASGHVFYERTSSFNTMSVARGQSSSTNFAVSGATETGLSTLFVIANGISSAGVPVTVH